MGAPHNIKRYGEVWPEFRIQSGQERGIDPVGHPKLCEIPTFYPNCNKI
jgi:hypothetical protein